MSAVRYPQLSQADLLRTLAPREAHNCALRDRSRQRLEVWLEGASYHEVHIGRTACKLA